VASDIGGLLVYLVPLLLLVLAVGFLLGRRGRDSRDLSGPPTLEAPPPASPAPSPAGRATILDPAMRMQIESALKANQKIEAIRLLREATGMGLKEAKEAVEDRRF
jgi:large subunit ribosomal protein L7/L12